MVEGSSTSQRMISVVPSKNGSSTAVLESGMSTMSDSLMPFQPAIEEPSNILPSSKKLWSTVCAGTVTCCSLPRVSVKRRSTYLTSFSFNMLRTSAAVVMRSPPVNSESDCPGPFAVTTPEVLLSLGPAKLQEPCHRTVMAQVVGFDREGLDDCAAIARFRGAF